METIERYDFGENVDILQVVGRGLMLPINNPLKAPHNSDAFIGKTVFANKKKWYIFALELQRMQLSKILPDQLIGLNLREVKEDSSIIKKYRLVNSTSILNYVERGELRGTHVFPVLVDPNNSFARYDYPDHSFAKYDKCSSALDLGIIELVGEKKLMLNDKQAAFLSEMHKGYVIVRLENNQAYLSKVGHHVDDETLKSLSDMGVITNTLTSDYRLTELGKSVISKNKNTH